jgi:hypothetical protein
VIRQNLSFSFIFSAYFTIMKDSFVLGAYVSNNNNPHSMRVLMTLMNCSSYYPLNSSFPKDTKKDFINQIILEKTSPKWQMQKKKTKLENIYNQLIYKLELNWNKSLLILSITKKKKEKKKRNPFCWKNSLYHEGSELNAIWQWKLKK